MPRDKIRKRLALFLLVGVFMILVLTGCWGKREIEDLAYTMAVGIDKGKEPGSYEFTFQIALPKKGGDGPEIGGHTISVETTSPVEGSERLMHILSKQDFPGANRIIIIGKDVAEDGINKIIDFYQRVYQLRRSAFLLLAEDKAKDILNIELRDKKLPAQHILSLIDNNIAWSGVPTVRLGHYLTVLARECEAPVIPVIKAIKSGENGISFNGNSEKPGELLLSGVGVFNGDRLAGYLDDNETKGYVWLQNEVKQRLFDTEALGGTNFGLRIIGNSTKAKLEKQDGVVGVHFDIKAKATLDLYMGTDKADDPFEMQGLLNEAQENTSELVRLRCQKAIEKAKELKLDCLGIGRQIEMRDPKYWKEIRDDWQTVLLKTPVDVEVQITFVGTGSSYGGPVNPGQTRQE